MNNKEETLKWLATQKWEITGKTFIDNIMTIWTSSCHKCPGEWPVCIGESHDICNANVIKLGTKPKLRTTR